MSELHYLERTVLRVLKNENKLNLPELELRTGLPEASISRAALWLSSKGYIKIEEVKQTSISLDAEGKHFHNTSFPERILVQAIVRNGGKLPLNQATTFSKQTGTEVNIAVGWAKKKGWLQIIREKGHTILVALKEPEKSPDEKLVDVLSQEEIYTEELSAELVEGFNMLRLRPKTIKLSEKTERYFVISSMGRDITQNNLGGSKEISQLTPELIKSGNWRKVKLRKYNIKAPVLEVWPGKKQPFLRFLDELKWKLAALGFKEMKGPLVEFMLFNCDALYMPQNHPAREIHDIYYIKYPPTGDLSQYSSVVRKVKLAHENGWITGSKGWGYQFSIKETEKLVLRSQGTATSVRMLIDKKLEIPGKYFSISRCYRPDVVDRTHLTEFNQIEGIILGEKLTFCNLLGVLKKFALDLAGADKIIFKPDYFPFTEPSVELAAYKKNLGWIEFGGAGIFRPEMTRPLGIKVPVIAWGLGVNRVFMMKSGLNDIRDLFSQNLGWLRSQKVM
ncbi:MAG: phenylalanine--tRNA ligase subunit alpha [Candidatus Bathyarchaeota archaeon]